MPISTPTCPARKQRVSSAQDASISCSGTWHSDCNRPLPRPHISKRRIIEEARTFQRMLRFAVVSEKYRSGGNNLPVDSVAIHLLQTHIHIPASRIDPPKFALAQHDYGLAGPVCLIHGQSGVPKRAAKSGQDSGKKCV